MACCKTVSHFCFILSNSLIEICLGIADINVTLLISIYIHLNIMKYELNTAKGSVIIVLL